MAKRRAVIPKPMKRQYDQFHFSPAVRVGKHLFCSGQVGNGPDGKLDPDPAVQIANAFENVRMILEKAGASFEDVDYKAPRKLEKALFQQLATGRWIAEKRNLLIIGPCGVGKNWLAAPSGRRPAATTPPSSTSACPGSSPNWISPMATGASSASSASSYKPISLFSTTGGQID